MIGCLALVNLLALSIAFLVDGWRGVLALLLVELAISLVAGVVLVTGLSQAEARERREVYRRWEAWAADRARRRPR
jgi:hypothetical protein